jgi:hypothetical protein
MNNKKFLRPLGRILAGSALAATLLLGTGCFIVAAGAAGAGTVAYIRGELDAPLDSGIDNAEHAANAALLQLQFPKVEETKDSLKATLTARTGDDKKVVIILTREGDNLTKVQIRIGFFGDEMISRAVLDHIKSSL